MVSFAIRSDFQACMAMFLSLFFSPPGVPEALSLGGRGKYFISFKNSGSCLSAVRQNIQDHFRVLAKARDWAHLCTLEAVFIASKKPALCAQKEHVKALRLL